MSVLRSAGRQIAFARHVPAKQVLHRVRLILLRAWDARFAPSCPAGAIDLCQSLPQPLFAPRPSSAVRTTGGWSFEFLGQCFATGPKIDWAGGGRQSKGQLWRMNLHYMEYLEQQTDANFVDLVMQWIAANQPASPGAHNDSWNAYALSIRVVVWMQQLAARSGLPTSAKQSIAESLAFQLAWLERHLERDIGGNHLLKNIKALLWASCVLDGVRAARWRDLGLCLLRKEIGRQFLADGMQFERSPSYHCQTFADLLEIRWALTEDPLGGLVDTTLQRAAQVAADLAHPDGLVCQFGDSGLTMSYPPGECLAAHARIFGAAPRPRAHFALPHAGYYGARSEGELLVMDAGPLGPDGLPGHAHGDMLAFEWSLGGERIVVDQGVFEYVAGARRDAARSCASHNTLSIEGADQADFYGAFRMGRRGSIRVIGYSFEADRLTVEAEHDGFALFGGPVHRRRLDHSPGWIRLEDVLIGLGGKNARVGFLLAPHVRATSVDGGNVRIKSARSTALVRGSFPLRIEDAVWWPDMGVECATVRLVMPLPIDERRSWIEIAIVGTEQ